MTQILHPSHSQSLFFPPQKNHPKDLEQGKIRFETMTSTDTGTINKAYLPKDFLDSHHHFVDTRNNPFQSFLGSLVDEVYVAEDYHRDVVETLKEVGVNVVGSIHVECMPDDGAKEVEWVESLKEKSNDKSFVVGTVASCDLSQPNVEEELSKLMKVSPNLKGIRWILDCVGKFDGGKTATHVATSRHDGICYLRGSNGGYDGSTVPEFERGFAVLEKYNLSFDLQCAPAQLPAAASLIAKYPNIPICLDHLGKPRTLFGPDTEENKNTTIPDANELAVWREGMKRMAALPNVYVKISMLGYAIPGWVRYDYRKQLMKELIRETVELFGPNRCMVATNWWKAAHVSDADGLSDVGPSPVELLSLLSTFLCDYSEDDRNRIFCETAKEFYKINM